MAEIIKFTQGVSEIIALKFDSGKNVTNKFGEQVQYSTVDDRIFWLDPDPAGDVERGLQELGIRAGQEFRLTKVKTSHGGSRFVVERQPEARRDAGGHNVPARSDAYAAPVAASYAAATPSAQTPITPASMKFCAAMMSMVDAMRETKAYAQRCGIDMSTEDLRCLAVTAFINDSKGGR
jgi:hypothetical protein